MNTYLITIVGPTAIGKTALSIKIAKHFNTEIISCDSRQFYKEMNIGTAVPSKKELAEIPHHFIQNRSVLDDYNVGQFEKEAIQTLNSLFKKHQVVVMVGGSGLYVNAVLNGLDYFPKIDPSIREGLKQKLKNEGIGSLQQQLKKQDVISFKNIDLDNHQRLIRALEICIGTKKQYSSFITDKTAKRSFIPITIGLTADREILYKRINNRVDIMMANGLEKEVTKLVKYNSLNALQTVGYKELFLYLKNEISLDFAIEEIKKNTRRFAKRQGTWFRKNKNILWFDFEDDFSEIISSISSQINISSE